MPSILNPYLSFGDNARQAIEFYKAVFGGNLNISTFGEGGMAQDPANTNKIMHAQLNSPSGFVLMASDTPPQRGQPRPNGAISLSGDNDAELRGYWNKLSDGAMVMMPLEAAPWGDTFGMLTDKFGVGWMVNIAGKRG